MSGCGRSSGAPGLLWGQVVMKSYAPGIIRKKTVLLLPVAFVMVVYHSNNIVITIHSFMFLCNVYSIIVFYFYVREK